MLRTQSIVRVLFAAGLAVLVASPQLMAADGVFMVVKGDVKVSSKGKISPAKVGSKVLPSDKIIAGKDSRAKVVMSDKNILNISPDTQVVVEKYVFDEKNDKKEVSLNVIYGKVRATVNQKYDGDKSKFQVKTPSAVAGVRGTDFLTSYSQATGSSKIVTFEGTVQMGTGVDANGNIANPVMVSPGQFSVASAGGSTPSQPAAVPPAELNAMNQETKADTATTGERAVAGESAPADKKDSKDNKENKDGDTMAVVLNLDLEAPVHPVAGQTKVETRAQPMNPRAEANEDRLRRALAQVVLVVPDPWDLLLC
jgi:hypothetical protein